MSIYLNFSLHYLCSSRDHAPVGEAAKRLEPVLPRLRVAEFTSSHSLRVYLWQIMMLAVVNYVLRISEHWAACLVVITIGNFVLTWVQNRAVGPVRRHRDFYVLRYFTC